MDALAGINIDKPCRQVRHGDLTRTDSEVWYRSDCPVCHEGVLPVCRDQETFQLERFDRCLLCGQQFEYTDIEELRKGEK